MDDLEIRYARAGDREDVFAISATVWEGHDYIPDVWDDWMGEKPDAGFLLAGEIDGRVVAIQHATLQPGGVVWVEGIRVHPDFRNRGIAHQLLQRALDIAGERGSTIARLSTATENKASQTVVGKNGFEEIARFHRFSASATSEEADSVQQVTASAECLARVREQTGDTATLIADGWTAYEVPRQKPPGDFPLSLATGDRPDGLALARPTPHRGRISIAYIRGSASAVTRLGEALRFEAGRQGVESAGGMLRRHPEVERGLAQAGYEMRDDLAMIVYQRSLDAHERH